MLSIRKTAFLALLTFSLVVSAATEVFTEPFDSIGEEWGSYSGNEDETANNYWMGSLSGAGSYHIETTGQTLEAGNGAWFGIRTQDAKLSGDFEVTLTSRNFSISGVGTERWGGSWRLRVEDRSDSAYDEGNRIELMHTQGYNPDTQKEFEGAKFRYRVDGAFQQLDGGNCDEGGSFCKSVIERTGDVTTMSIKRVDDTVYAYFNGMLIGSFSGVVTDDLYIKPSAYIYNTEAGALRSFHGELDELTVRPLVDGTDITTDTITLNPGWNLVSPSVEDGRSIETLLDGVAIRALSYKPMCNCNGWSGIDLNRGVDTLHRLRSDHGYWIESEAGGNIQLRGVAASERVTNLQRGWNLLGSGSATTSTKLRERIQARSPTITIDQIVACDQTGSTCVVENAEPLSPVSLQTQQGVWVQLEDPESDTTPPVATLSVDIQSVTSATVATLTAEATDDYAVRQVDFYESGRLLGSDLVAPYTHPVLVNRIENGTHQYTAQAVDLVGNRTTTAPLTVEVAIDPETATGIDAAKQLIDDVRTWVNSVEGDLSQPETDFMNDLERVEQLHSIALSQPIEHLLHLVEMAARYYDHGVDGSLISGEISPFNYDLSQLGGGEQFSGTGTLLPIESDEGVDRLHIIAADERADLLISLPPSGRVTEAVSLDVFGTVASEEAQLEVAGARVIASWSDHFVWDDEMEWTDDLLSYSIGLSGALTYTEPGTSNTYTFEGDMNATGRNEQLQGEQEFIPQSIQMDGTFGDGNHSNRIYTVAQFSNGDGLALDSQESEENYWQIGLTVGMEVDLKDLPPAQVTLHTDRSGRYAADVEVILAYDNVATELNFALSNLRSESNTQLESAGEYTFSNGVAHGEMSVNHDTVTGTLSIAGVVVGNISEDNIGIRVDYTNGDWEYF